MRLLISFLLILFWTSGQAQGVREIYVDESANGKALNELLEEIEDDYDVEFIGDREKMKMLTVTGVTEKQRLMDFLQYFSYTLKIVRVNDNVIFMVDKAVADFYGLRKEDYVALEKKTGSENSISGVITDGENDDPIVGAQIYFPLIKQGVSSDVNGNFNFKTTYNPFVLLQIKFIGFDTRMFLVARSKYGKVKDISSKLYPASQILQDVTITAERTNDNVIGQITGVERLSIQTIKSLPTFMGEVDPVRSLATLPGVSTVGELSSGFNVRGGESGQNLILQDGAPIYNPSHLFGFFSAFNPDMVNGVTLYKGGGPANFGGRISSVLDITLKNGNSDKTTVSGGVGLVSSRLSVEGPIVKGKSSYVVGGRIAYPNWLINSTKNKELENSEANFYDVNAKIFHTINQNNFISLSVYDSYDDFKLATDSTFSWGTLNFSLRWDHTFNERLSSSLGVFNSKYFSRVESLDEIDPFIYENEIKTSSLKYNLHFAQSEDLKLLGGIELIHVGIEPGRLSPSNPLGNIQYQNMNDQREIEGAVYVQGDYDITDKWAISAGLRYSHFLRLGPEDIYVFDYSNIDGRYPVVTDTISYKSGDIIKQYHGFEPRLSLRYLMTKNFSIKGSYYRGYQYLHLISNTTSTTPQDYWVASGPYLKPEIGDQFSLGVFKSTSNNKYDFSLEGFYKKIYNTVDYIEGADITLNPKLEAGLAQGQGLAYGMEVLLKRKVGTINGWLAYTYSRSLRKFESELEVKTINEGDYYPSFFDKPHNVSLVLNYQLAERTVLSANFNYSTGRPITIPESKFSYDSYLAILNYSERNEYRIPDYHRLDLSITFKDNPNKGRRIRGEWIFSIYNVYGRKNAYSIYFNRYGTANKLSVLGSVFPSFSYNFKF